MKSVGGEVPSVAGSLERVEQAKTDVSRTVGKGPSKGREVATEDAAKKLGWLDPDEAAQGGYAATVLNDVLGQSEALKLSSLTAYTKDGKPLFAEEGKQPSVQAEEWTPPGTNEKFCKIPLRLIGKDAAGKCVVIDRYIFVRSPPPLDENTIKGVLWAERQQIRALTGQTTVKVGEKAKGLDQEIFKTAVNNPTFKFTVEQVKGDEKIKKLQDQHNVTLLDKSGSTPQERTALAVHLVGENKLFEKLKEAPPPFPARDKKVEPGPRGPPAVPTRPAPQPPQPTRSAPRPGGPPASPTYPAPRPPQPQSSVVVSMAESVPPPAPQSTGEKLVLAQKSPLPEPTRAAPQPPMRPQVPQPSVAASSAKQEDAPPPLPAKPEKKASASGSESIPPKPQGQAPQPPQPQSSVVASETEQEVPSPLPERNGKAKAREVPASGSEGPSSKPTGPAPRPEGPSSKPTGSAPPSEGVESKGDFILSSKEEEAFEKIKDELKKIKDLREEYQQHMAAYNEAGRVRDEVLHKRPNLSDEEFDGAGGDALIAKRQEAEEKYFEALIKVTETAKKFSDALGEAKKIVDDVQKKSDIGEPFKSECKKESEKLEKPSEDIKKSLLELQKRDKEWQEAESKIPKIPSPGSKEFDALSKALRGKMEEKRAKTPVTSEQEPQVQKEKITEEKSPPSPPPPPPPPPSPSSPSTASKEVPGREGLLEEIRRGKKLNKPRLGTPAKTAQGVETFEKLKKKIPVKLQPTDTRQGASDEEWKETETQAGG